MSRTPPPSAFAAPGGAVIGVVLAGLAALVLAAAWNARTSPLRPAVQRPGSAMAVRDRCIDCHSDIVDSYRNAPHARTLHRMSEPETLARFAGKSFTRPTTGIEYHYTERDGRLWMSTPAYARELPIDWVFGSGSHAQTPLILMPREEGRTGAIEHVVSWYPSGKLETTFGAEANDSMSGLDAVGRLWGPAEAANCFGCHSAEVPVDDGRLDVEKLHANLDCARCHWNTAEHVRQMDGDGATTIERLGSLPPLEAIERCGECHRRAEDFDNAIFHDNKSIIRFAPVGLIQSECFLKQADVKTADGRVGRMDCATCHDPHVGSIRPDMVAVSCGKCHTGAETAAKHCTSSMTDANCLPCHMPKVPMNDELSFTDHWIRVFQDK